MTNPRQPALLIMAAGIGSRYGGLKQVDPIGPGGEMVVDYAIYDALRAGFDKVVFVIRKDIEDIFREKVGRNIETQVETQYAFQDLEDLPPGFTLPPERKKPWGTGHAVLAARGLIDTPCAVINADDFYGPHAFQTLAEYLRSAEDRDGIYDYAMVGYVLRNTLSENGTVARGVCEVTADGYLKTVVERTKIQAFDSAVKYTENGEDWFPLPADSLVSLNFWGFTPSIFAELQARFPVFLNRHAGSLEKTEFFLPEVVNELLKEGRAQVKVLPTHEKWYGVTYPQDRPDVQAAIHEMIRQGQYPEHLWG